MWSEAFQHSPTIFHFLISQTGTAHTTKLTAFVLHNAYNSWLQRKQLRILQQKGAVDGDLAATS